MNITKNIKIVISITILSVGLLGFSLNLKPEPQKDKVLIGVLRYILKNWHYEPKEMDDDFSKAVYADFIDEMDPIKRYFTQKDIKEFSTYETLIDDQLKREDLTFYYAVMDRFKTRLDESQKFYKEILQNKFNYDKDETINVDYKNIDFAKNQNELIEYWRKQMKFNALSKIQTLLEVEEDKLKEDPTYKKRSFDVLEIEAREKLIESLDDFYKRINELNHTDWFSTFINSIAEEFDPHTTYFAPKIKELFDINISGKIEGIGARLQQKNDYTKIVELISGGPAWKQGDLEVGDIILKAAEKGKESTDIVGMRLDDAIKYIKGKKGTEVILTVKKVDNSIVKITIIRDVVEIDETFVKSSIAHKDGKKYGIINLPKFYIDFNDTNSRDSGSDMEREIENLKKEGVEGLLIDLRNNGGGSLRTAIQIGGLFIDKGPIVQVKYRDNEPAVKDDTNPKIQWDGPLVILVNELSASASEILAAAMQDYKRAVIIGSKQTYGKGTVQNVIPLNKSYNYPEDLGALKLTIQKFYRINGGSTQLEGVHSDIAMPSKYSYVQIGEREQENPLAWDKIKKANYNSLDYYENYDAVINNSKMRISQNKEFNLINEYAKWLKESQDTNEFSLNLKTSNKEQEKHQKRSEHFKDVFKHKSNIDFTSPLYELSLTKNDTVLKSKRVAWHENLTKDIYIDESLKVLSELKINNRTFLAKK
ncbi:carboxy terminal-processing peptidase [Bacteroidota bacterium]